MKTERTDRAMNMRPLVPLLFSVVVVVALIAGLWPFRSSPVNGARLSGTALEFGSFGVAGACSSGLLFPSGEASVYISSTPRRLARGQSGSLISFYDRGGIEVLSVRQWGDRLVVHSGPEAIAGASSAFGAGRKTHVTVTAGSGGVRLYVDGKPSGSSLKPFHGLERAGCYVMGTAPEGKNSWSGSIDGLALWGRALTQAEAREAATQSSGLLARYQFEGAGPAAKNSVSDGLHITVPEVFRPVRKIFLGPLYEDRGRVRLDPLDGALNVAGFVPVGLLAFFLRPGVRKVSSNVIFALFAGFALSLFIESVQVFLPGRFSHLTDLVLNTAGAGAGAYIAVLLKKRR